MYNVLHLLGCKIIIMCMRTTRIIVLFIRVHILCTRINNIMQYPPINL